MQTDQGNISTVNTERELVAAQQPLVYQNPNQQYPVQQNPAYAQPQQGYYQQQQYGAPNQQMAPQQMAPQPMGQPGQQMVPQVVQLTQYPSSAEGCRTTIVIQCPYCRQVGTTRVVHVAGNKAYWISCLLCFTLPCLVCVPCCVDSCQRVQSFCQHCAKQVGQAD